MHNCNKNNLIFFIFWTELSFKHKEHNIKLSIKTGRYNLVKTGSNAYNGNTHNNSIFILYVFSNIKLIVSDSLNIFFFFAYQTKDIQINWKIIQKANLYKEDSFANSLKYNSIFPDENIPIFFTILGIYLTITTAIALKSTSIFVLYLSGIRKNNNGKI